MNELVSNLVVWTLLWTLSWGFFFMYLQIRVNYIRFYLITSLYFLATALITIFVFRGYISQVIQNFTVIPFVILGLVYAAHIILYYYFRGYVREPKEYFQRHPKRTYLFIDYRRLFSKSFDLFSQQVFIVLLAFFLKEAGLTIKEIIVAFALIFGIVHAPLIWLDKGWPAWYFTVFAVLSAIVFPLLILKVNYGFVYSYIVHMVFYTLTAIGFWLIYPNPHK